MIWTNICQNTNVWHFQVLVDLSLKLDFGGSNLMIVTPFGHCLRLTLRDTGTVAGRGTLPWGKSLSCSFSFSSTLAVIGEGDRIE